MIERAAARYLASLGLVTTNEGDIGGDVFVGFMPSRPDVAVSIVRYGAGPQLTRNPTSLPRLQFRCRGTKDDPVGPAEQAQAIYSALACLDGAHMDPDGPDEVWVIGATPIQSSPYPLGADENGRHEWVSSHEFRVHDPTAHRPALA